MTDLQEYAKENLQSSSLKISKKYTVGFANLIGLEERFSFISQKLGDIKDYIVEELPVVIYQTRQSPPESMIAAIPCEIGTEPLSCRLISTTKLNDIELLSEFARSIWVLIGTEGLPHPFLRHDAFERELTDWTTEKLFKL